MQIFVNFGKFCRFCEPPGAKIGEIGPEIANLGAGGPEITQ